MTQASRLYSWAVIGGIDWQAQSAVGLYGSSKAGL